MAYVKKTWENKPSTASPINANNLNHIEGGIYNNDVHIDNVDLYLQTVAGDVNNLQSDKMNKNNPTGTGFVQLGEDASANSQYGTPTFAIGRNAKAYGYNSYAIGEGVEANDGDQIAIGRYNDKTSNAQFMIGGGVDDNNRQNLLEFAYNGDATFCAEVTDGTGNTLSAKANTSDVIDMLPVDAESGNPCVITDAFNTDAKSLKLTLNPIQSGSGTPSPSNVRPISGRTQSVINATGRNLYIGSPSFDGYTNLSNWTLQTEKYNGHDVYKNVGGWNGLNKTIFLQAGTYTFSCMAKGSQANTPLYIFNASNTILLSTTVGTSWQRVSAVLNQGTDSNVTLRAETSGATPSLYVSEYMLEKGSEATPYQEWGETITRTYGATVYGGTDDVTGDGAISEYGLVEFDGSVDENWQTGLASNCFSIARGEVPADLAPSKYITSSFEPSDSAVTGKMYVGTNYINVCYTAVIATVADWRTYLSSHPLQICYKLTTATSIPLTSQNITLFHGDNVLTTDADSIEASYSADIALYIAKKIAEGSQQGNRSLSKGGSSEKSLEEIDLKEEVKEEVKEETEKTVESEEK